jgi:TonB-dependent starch-binding outer membrane protein SusC
MRKFTILFLGLMLVLTTLVYGQERVITGTITSGEDGSPLPGASVVVKGTTTGTTTDMDGKFTLSVPENSTVVVSFVGYLAEEVAITTQTEITVTLLPDISRLDEIVVIGYGVQKKSLVTGSIAKVEAKDLENSVSTRFEQALQGKVSGMVVAQNSGAPGSDLTIKIRGNTSDRSNSPLIIVDGVRTGGMDYLNPADIASIEVLKDAASSAIYGADGGNGVILITTKKGEKNTSILQYNFTHSIQKPTNLMQVMNGNQYRDYFMEAATWEKKTANYNTFSKLDSTVNTNWVDEIFQSAPMDEHNISFSGGSEKTSYFISGSYLTQDGIVGGPKNNFTRYSFRTNIETEVKSWFSVGSNISYSRSNKKNLNATNEYGGIINNAYTYEPTLPVYWTDVNSMPEDYRNDSTLMQAWNRTPEGYYYTKSKITGGEAWNPVAQIDYTQDKQTQDKIVADLHADLKPFKWLKLTSRIFVDYAYQKHDVFTDKNVYGVSPLEADTDTYVQQTWDRWYKYGIENYLTFNKQIGDHAIEVMLGQSYEDYKHDYLYTKFFNIPYTSIDYAFPAASIDRYRFDVNDQSTDDYSMSKLASYYGRFVYNYKEKYMLQGNFRYDGASNFGPDKPWAFFPSFSAGWVISKEDFFRSVDQLSFIDVMKLRASWGQNGSRQSLNSFPYVTTMTTIYYSDASPAGSRDVGKVPGVPANRAITWETSQQTDIGVDFRFLRNTLTFSADWYKKSTIGQLAEKADMPTYLGFQGNPQVNNGEIMNRGWEFDLGYRNSAGEFHYYANFNASYLHNEVVDYGVKQGKDGANVGQLGVINRYDIGQPVWYFYGYEATGIFQDTAQINHYGYTNPSTGRFVKLQPSAKPGDVIFKDQPVDSLGGATDQQLDAGDRVYIGKPMPDWTFGLTLGCEFMGFDLSLFFQGVTGNQVYWAGYRNDRTEYNRSVMWYDERWTGPGTSYKYPRATDTDANNNFRVSSLNVYDGDYLRLKNLTIGYTLPANLSNKIFIKKLRIFYTGTNLLTWTKYPGTDPEVGMYDPNNNYSLGVDKGLYPPTMIHSFGVNVIF